MNNMSNIPASSLPKITALRHELDYGDPGLARCSAFYDDVRAFRKKFHTRQGIPGLSLHDWKSIEHQNGLAHMTAAYLDDEGNGQLFWPDDMSAANYNKLQYSKDHYRIKKLLKQLFFRLNEQQHRNNKYKHKDKQPGSAGLAGNKQNEVGKGSTEYIDLSAIDTEPEIHWSHSEPAPNTRDHFSKPKNTSSEPRRESHEPKIIRGQTDDIYAVPGSPEPDDDQNEFLISMQETALSRDRHTPKAKRPFHPTVDASQGHQVKRSKAHYRSASENETQSSTPNHSAQHATKRKSPRRKKGYRAGQEFLTGQDYIIAMDMGTTEAVKDTETNRYVTEDRSLKRTGNGSTSIFRGTQSSENLPHLRQKSTQDFTSVNHPQINDEAIQAVAETHDSPVARDYHETHDSIFIPYSHSTAPAGLKEPPGITRKPDASSPQTPKKPIIDFIYRLVLSRSPVYSYRKWRPAKKLEQTSFQEFLEELPLDGNVKGLYFTVEGPGLKAVEELRRGDETGFQSLIKQIKRVISRQLATRDPSNAHLVFEMAVEPIRDEGAEGDENLDNVEFEI